MVRDRPPRSVTAEGGPVRDCGMCHHWQPGAVVIRGSTIGWCLAFDASVPADFGCDAWTRKVRVSLVGEPQHGTAGR
jgi:hypothetical protein